MRIVTINAGAGNAYCETCLRDQALLAALRRAGHDVLLIPLYLPPLALTPEDRRARLFLGGINAYLQQKVALFRHTPRWVDWFLDAHWLLNFSARFASMTNPRDLGEVTVSTLRGEAGYQAKEFRALVAWLKTQPPPDVICLSNSLLLGFAPPLRAAFQVPIVCSLQGADSFINGLPAPYAERTWEMLRALVPEVAAFAAVSRYCAEAMNQYLRIPSERLHVVRGSVALDPFLAAPVVTPASPTIGYLTQLMPGMGLGTLVDAFLRLKREQRVPGLRLHVGGYTEPGHRRFVAEQQAKVAAANAAADCLFVDVATVADKVRFLREVSVFCVPATYGEPQGLYALEAWAAGRPVVAPRHGVFPELLGLTGGGVLCAPDHPAALAEALAGLLTDPARATQLGAAGRQAVAKLFAPDQLAADFVQVLTQVVTPRP